MTRGRGVWLALGLGLPVALLLASAAYEEIGVDRAKAQLNARFLGEFAADVIRKEHPTLAEKMVTRTCTLHWGSRAWEIT